MGSMSVWHWLIVLAVVLLLFGGGGKIPKLMKDFGQGINAFKRGLKETKDKDADGEVDPAAGATATAASAGQAPVNPAPLNPAPGPAANAAAASPQGMPAGSVSSSRHRS